MDIEVKRCQEESGGYMVFINGQCVKYFPEIEEAVKYAESNREKVNGNATK